MEFLSSLVILECFKFEKKSNQDSLSLEHRPQRELLSGLACFPVQLRTTCVAIDSGLGPSHVIKKEYSPHRHSHRPV